MIYSFNTLSNGYRGYIIDESITKPLSIKFLIKSYRYIDFYEINNKTNTLIITSAPYNIDAK